MKLISANVSKTKTDVSTANCFQCFDVFSLEFLNIYTLLCNFFSIFRKTGKR